MTFLEIDAVLIKILSNEGFSAHAIAELYQCGEPQISDILHRRTHRTARSAKLNLTPTGRVTLVSANHPNEHTTRQA